MRIKLEANKCYWAYDNDNLNIQGGWNLKIIFYAF
jgi:hypothetical protein